MAAPHEVVACKRLADRHKHELGYVMRASLTKAQERAELWVVAAGAEVAGFAYVWHRRDGQTTLHAIAVDDQYRRRGFGDALLSGIRRDALERGQACIVARCPTDLESNRWYATQGFALVCCEAGKHRRLNVWIRHASEAREAETRMRQ